MPPPPDPVATSMQQDAARHGETVFSEAGVSQSADGRWSSDTGIQLAAAQAEAEGEQLARPGLSTPQFMGAVCIRKSDRSSDMLHTVLTSASLPAVCLSSLAEKSQGLTQGLCRPVISHD